MSNIEKGLDFETNTSQYFTYEDEVWVVFMSSKSVV